MDNLISLFRQNFSTDRSPQDFVNMLGEIAKDAIKIVVIPLGGCEQQSILYSASVIIHNDKSFVANDPCKQKAEEKVAYMAFDYLFDVAKMGQLEEDDGDNSLVGLSEKFEKKLNILDDELVDVNSKNVSSQCYDSDWGFNVPYLDVESVFASDNDTSNKLNYLKINGYQIECKCQSFADQNSRETLFRVTAELFCLGEFVEQIDKEKNLAIRKAVLNLLLNLNGVFPFEDNDSKDRSFEDDFVYEDAHQELVVQKPVEMNPTETELQENTFHDETTLLRAWKLIEIINCFNSVCNSNKHPLETIKEMIKLHPNLFEFQVKHHSNHIRTTLKIINMCTFTGAGCTELDSQHQAYLLTFGRFRNISLLLNSFKRIHSSGDVNETMQQLINENPDVVKFFLFNPNTTRMCSNYHCTMVIVGFCSFTEEASKKYDCKLSVFRKMFAYLKALLLMYEEPKILNESSQFPQCASELELYDTDLKKIELIRNFIIVNDSGKSPSCIMNELLNIDRSSFTFRANFIPNLALNPYKTTLKVFGCSFQASGNTKQSSRNNALAQFYTILFNIIQLLANFQSIYSVKRSNLEILDELVQKNGQVCKINFNQTSEGKIHHAKVIITNMRNFDSFEKTLYESKNAVSKQAIQYLKSVSQMVEMKKRD